MKKIKLIVASTLVGTMLTANLLPAVAYASELGSESTINEVVEQVNSGELTLDQAIENTIGYFRTHKNSLSSFWELVALKYVGEDILSSPYTIQEWSETSVGENTSIIDDAGFILGIVAKGEDPKNFKGKDFAKILADKQRKYGDGSESFNGGNFNIWSIIALEIANQEYDKEFAIETLKKYQKDDGSFGMSLMWDGTTDLTGMGLIAIGLLQKDEAYKSSEKLNEMKSNALNYLEQAKREDGTFNYDINSDKQDGNSTAMAITGLIAAGEDLNSARWNGVDTGLTGLQASEDGEVKTNWGSVIKYYKGQFWYRPADKMINDMSTYQCLIAAGDIKSGKSAWDRLDEEYEAYEIERENKKLPKITAENIQANVGDDIDLLSQVKAEDMNGLDLTEKITIQKSTLPIVGGVVTKAGSYNVTYEVVDGEGRSNIKTIEVNVSSVENLIVASGEEEVKAEIERIEEMLKEVDANGVALYSLGEVESEEIADGYVAYNYLLRANFEGGMDKKIRFILPKDVENPVINVPEIKPDETPEEKPEEKPEVKPEVKPENKPTLPQTGGQSTLPMAVAGITTLLAGIGIKFRRK